MGVIYSGEYRCLEILAKSEDGKKSAVLVVGPSGKAAAYPAGKWQYRLIRIPLEKNCRYEVRLENCTASICYLSEADDILDRGVCFLEYSDGNWRKTDNLKEWYQTPNREQYHFCPYKNWINDPNGLCWYRGYYHMYYQANPHSQEWGHMYWGHAASRDCVHWVHLPFVLMPQEEILNAKDRKGGAFSGSAVVLEDRIRFYLTRHFGPPDDSEEETVQYQTMVESEDGIHFGEEKTIIEKPNSDFSFNFRDPKVIRYDNCWQMVIGTRIKNVPSIVRYTSSDGENWKYGGVVLEEKTEGVYTFECPDIFPLSSEMVLTGAWMFYADEQRRFQPTYYYLGNYRNGRLEIRDRGLYDFAGNFYAVQSFEHEGRRIAIGWISDFYQEHCPEENGAYGSMAIPRELFMENQKLHIRPIKEIYQLKGKCCCNVERQNVRLKHLNNNSYYARLTFSANVDFEILLGKSEVGEIRLVRKNETLQIVTTGVKSHYVQFVTELQELRELEIFVDRRTVEVFANNGECAGTKLFYGERDGIFEAEFEKEEAAEEIEVYEMKGIWR